MSIYCRQNSVEYANCKSRIELFLEHEVLVTWKHLKLPHIYNKKFIFRLLREWANYLISLNALYWVATLESKKLDCKITYSSWKHLGKKEAEERVLIADELLCEVWRKSSLVTESQNHRKVVFGRDLWRSSSPTPPAKADSPGAGGTGPCPGEFWVSPEKENPQEACPRTLSPSKWKSSSSCSDGISYAPCPVAGHRWKESGPILLTLTIKIFIGIYQVPSSLLFFRLNKPSSLSLSLYKRWSSPRVIFVTLHWTLSSSSSSFFNWGAQNRVKYSRWGLTRAEYRRQFSIQKSPLLHIILL